ncbi:10452_t:CDS:2 [Entrophospora sp. SA101]|nr:9207_t:CDS:2 [Entrophospora sp. SA101]CAJ0762590.1 10452_t:CDS:2 [Entrophospora sp. SA101]
MLHLRTWVIDKIREELSAPDYPYKNIDLPENPTAEEKTKVRNLPNHCSLYFKHHHCF